MNEMYVFSEEPKYCVNCKHCVDPVNEQSAHRCGVKQSTIVDMVTGKVWTDYDSCYSMRYMGTECGREAKLFEPKEVGQ